ncbi:MAG: LVIVD repeat-containing protein, partial [Planctomycetota bacterium]
MKRIPIVPISLVLVVSVCLTLKAHADLPVAASPLERSLAYKSHLYINQGKNLVVVEQDNPVQVKCVFGLDDHIRQIAFNNSTTSLYSGSPPTAGADYAFVIIHNGDVKIIDISDPNSLQVVKTINPTPSYKTHYIMAAGDRLYMTEAASFIVWNLRIFDISTPLAASLLGEKSLGTHFGHDAGGHIRQIDADKIIYDIPKRMVQIQDVSDPTDIEHVFTWFYSSNGGLLTKNGWAYFAIVDNWIGSFQVWDVSDPANPMPGGSIANIASKIPYHSTVTLLDKAGENYVLMGAHNIYFEWLVVIKVTDPADPEVVKVVRIESPTGDVVPFDIDIVGNEALISGWNMPWPGYGKRYRYRYYLVRMDMTDPTDPQWVSTVEIPSLFVIDQNYSAVGSAVIETNNLGHLVMTNLDATGESGAQFDGTECTDTCDEVIGDFDAVAGGWISASGLELVLYGTLSGSLSGAEDTRLGAVSLTYSAGSTEVAVDYSAIGPGSVEIEVHSGDSVVDAATVAGGDTVGIISAADGPMPQVTGFSFGSPSTAFTDDNRPFRCILN